MFTISVVIPTYNRQEELKNCIQSIVSQSIKPKELIIIDDGDLQTIPLEKECTQEGIECIYFKKDEPGLTESRNKGVALASGDIIQFFDDDVILRDDFFKEILEVYERDGNHSVGGVGGVIENRKHLTLPRRFRRLLDIVFLMSGFREGRVLPSGFCTDYGTTEFQIKTVEEVDFFSGCVMSFRKGVFDDFSFTGGYRDYGFGEDKDFSYQVSKKYKLLITPKAGLLHLESPKMRPDKEMYGRKFVLGRYLFLRDHVKKSRRNEVLFFYSLAGYLFVRSLYFVIRPTQSEFSHVKGILMAIKEILKESFFNVRIKR